ncbi:MAG: proline racemase family protein [Gemmatimonadota bacterium]|nr:proline racemase family protein [Gemmatimonadota bacterium]
MNPRRSNEWAEAVRAWTPPGTWTRLLTIDAHTEGEPLRVVLAGFPDLDGTTVLERRREARNDHDLLRRALMWEPRGHADMYGCIVGPPLTPEADVSVLFTHNEGFSTMCGHGIIGVVKVLLDVGLIRPTEPETSVGIDTPAGFVRATASVREGHVERTSFINVPSFASRLDAEADVPEVGTTRYDLAYGGAFYAYVAAEDFGLSLSPHEYGRLIDLGRAIKNAVQNSDPPNHPDDEDLGFVYGTIFVGPAHDPAHHSRNVCVFADGEVDRSPTGTGVSGRLAIHHARGEIGTGESIVVESILGTHFSGVVSHVTSVGGHAAVVPEVSGRAWITGRNEILIDPSDPVAHGFLIR